MIASAWASHRGPQTRLPRSAMSYDQRADKKTENNPETMSALLHKLGLSKELSFHDVFSIDDPDLLAFVPRPAHALLLVFPVSDTYEKFRLEEDGKKEEYEGFGPDEEVVWYKQTIGNACGLIGVLHGVSNGEARSHIGTQKIGFDSDIKELSS